MTAIWEHLAANVLPGLRDDRPLWFVDLADPAKRSREDLHRALDVLSKLQEFADIILGVNEAEARQVIEVLGGSWKGGSEDLEAAEACCVELRQRLGLHRVVCHQVKGAAGAGPDGSAAVVGFFEPKPKITTGAGDHFNAGYSFSIAAGLDEAAALCAGTATSGFYVRTAKSPAVADLIAFCRS
jgi:sugar/nucleoside kinase (ribokinase family)